MEKIYITFGSWERFPYQNTYMVVYAKTIKKALKAFRDKYPDVNENTYNFSDYYTEQQWNKRHKELYPGEPVESIWVEEATEKIPDGFDDIYVFIPPKMEIVRIAEGTGDNLLKEDEQEGYVDYIYYDIHSLEPDIPESDGGMVLSTELIQEKYERLACCIPEVMDMAYGDPMIDRIILCQAKKT